MYYFCSTDSNTITTGKEVLKLYFLLFFFSILKNNGLRHFYRGFSSPFVAQTVYKSIIFTTNSLCKSVILPNINPIKEYNKFLFKLFCCGAVAGSVNSFVVTPVEFIRNNLIIVSKDQVKSPYFLLRQLMNSEKTKLKFFSKIYTGTHLTMIRDGGGRKEEKKVE